MNDNKAIEILKKELGFELSEAEGQFCQPGGFPIAAVFVAKGLWRAALSREKKIQELEAEIERLKVALKQLQVKYLNDTAEQSGDVEQLAQGEK